MGKTVFGLTWGLILAAAVYDAHFAWQYRLGMESWELNPLARWAAREFGLGAVFAFKAAAILVAAALACYCYHRHPRLQRSTTLIVASAYGLLSLHYLIGFLQPLDDVTPPREVAMYAPYAPPRGATD